jgi:hypothetical protein
MSKRTYTFGTIVLIHEIDGATQQHRLFAVGDNSPWHPVERVISYDISGRYFAAVIDPGLPSCFEIIPSNEYILEQDETLGTYANGANEKHRRNKAMKILERIDWLAMMLADCGKKSRLGRILISVVSVSFAITIYGLFYDWSPVRLHLIYTFGVLVPLGIFMGLAFLRRVWQVYQGYL